MNNKIKKVLITGASLLIFASIGSSINIQPIHASYLNHIHYVTQRTIRMEKRRGGEIEDYEYGLGTGNYKMRKELVHNMIETNGYNGTYRILKHWFGSGSAHYLLGVRSHKRSYKKHVYHKHYKHSYKKHFYKRKNYINKKLNTLGYNEGTIYHHDDLVDGTFHNRDKKALQIRNKYQNNKSFMKGWNEGLELDE